MPAVPPLDEPLDSPPLPTPPESPEGVEPATPAPVWAPWTAFTALITAFGIGLFGVLVIGTIAAVFGADITDPPAGVNVLSVIVQDGGFIGGAILFARMAGPVRPWQFGLRPTRVRRAVGLVALAFVSFILFSWAWVTALGITQKDKLPDELGANTSTLALFAVAFLVTVVAPIAEEVLFRGYVFGALRNWRGTWPAALITGSLFGLIHVGSSPIGFLVPLAFLGVALCLLYARTGSLYPCIALHSINNSIAFASPEGWWFWQIMVLLVVALAIIAAALFAVRRYFGPEPAPERASVPVPPPAFGTV